MLLKRSDLPDRNKNIRFEDIRLNSFDKDFSNSDNVDFYDTDGSGKNLKITINKKRVL